MVTLIDTVSGGIDPDTLQTDVLIVGSGPAGLALAMRLSELGIAYLVVESGNKAIGSAQRLAGGKNTGIDYYDLSATRIRALGGTTNVWGGNTRILDELEFSERAYIPYSGWPIKYADFRGYGAQALATLNLSDDWAPDELGNYTSIWPYKEGAFKIDTFKLSPVLATINSQVTPGRRGNYYEYNAQRIKGTILLNTTVRRLEFAPNGRVMAVAAVASDGNHVRLIADRYVLACGGIENARFLLIHHEIGIGPIRDLPTIGKFFMEHPHPRLGTVKPFKKPVRPLLPKAARHRDGGVWQWRFFLKPEIQQQLGLPSMLFRLRPVEKSPNLFQVVGLFEQCPNPSSYVGLSPQITDDLGDPETVLHYDRYDWEYERYYRAAELLAIDFGAQHFGRSVLPIPPREFDKNSVGLGAGHHHMGTTRMGVTSGNSVVDSDLKVWGVPNLYVAGSSVFPTGGCVNPTVNLIMLSLRLGDHLARTRQ